MIRFHDYYQRTKDAHNSSREKPMIYEEQYDM